MNVERIRKLADHIEPLAAARDEDNGWDEATEESRWVDMSRWCEKGSCGTVACIAGHTLLLFDPDGADYHVSRGDAAGRAAELLGLADSIDAYYGGNGIDDDDSDMRREELRLIGVAKGLFFPHGVTVWDGRDCAEVLRAVADDPDTMTCGGVRGLWDSLEAE